MTPPPPPPGGLARIGDPPDPETASVLLEQAAATAIDAMLALRVAAMRTARTADDRALMRSVARQADELDHFLRGLYGGEVDEEAHDPELVRRHRS